MKFVKQSFLGIELDILIGHPEHDLLFIATQVARAAGLKDPAGSAAWFAKILRAQGTAMCLGTVAGQIEDYSICGPKDSIGRSLQLRAPILTEPQVYTMLLRGHAPQSEPFRKWVTEEVLPSIRKTGSYNVNESETPEAQQFSGEFSQLHAALQELTSEVRSLKDIIAGLQNSSLVGAAGEPIGSPYEEQRGVAVCDPAGFNKRLFAELSEPLLDQLAAERMLKRVVIEMDLRLGRVWKQEDGRQLKETVSEGQKRKWTLFPQKWLQDRMNRQFYMECIRHCLSEKVSS